MTVINNLPDYAKEYEFIVARQADDGEWWFWGAYETDKTAERVANEIGGFIFLNSEIEGF